MLASLMVVSALFFFAVATWLPQLRRILTPAVSGTVLMLIAVSVLPFCLDRFDEAPSGALPFSGPIVAVVTLAVSTALILRAPPRLRPWSMLLGFVSGCVVAALLGAYELERLRSAPWVGIPEAGFQGLDMTPSAGFWALLPMFLIVTLVQAIKGIGDNVVIQRTARRRPRATNFRLLQGSIYANGVGILLSGIAGTPPTSSYSSFTASTVNMTGRRFALCRIRDCSHACGNGAASQVDRRASYDTESGDGGIPAGCSGSIFRGGTSNHHSRRTQP